MTALGSGAERRRHPRYDLLVQVRVKRAQSDLLMSLTNISKSGAMVDMGSLKRPAWVDIGRQVELSIVHPDTLDTVDLSAKVVRLNSDEHRTEFAVAFVDLDADAERGIEWLIDTADTRKVRPPPLPQ